MPSPKWGDVRDDGYIFNGYIRVKGVRRELWNSPRAVDHKRLLANIRGMRKRAKREGVPFDLNAPFLNSIYPADGLCPVFRTPMVRGAESGRDNSPSIDRIKPSKGYVVGNVRWVSNGANRLRAAFSIEQLERLLALLKKEDTTHA